MLDRVLRRCPLTPAEVARIEEQLPPLLADASPSTLTPLFEAALAHRSRAYRAQVLAILEQPASPRAEDAGWQAECQRVLEALVDGLQRLQRQRALGMAVYAVTNRLLGDPGTQALYWARQTRALATVLTEDGWGAWLRWLAQLPLPSLRAGAWLEPLIAALPSGLRDALADAEAAHAVLERTLAPSSSPLRLVLLGTAWLLWTRRPHPADTPATRVGRRLAQVPARLNDVELLGQASRRLFAVPEASGSAPATTALLSSAMAVAIAALRPGSRGSGALAAAGWVLASMPLAQAGRSPPRAEAADEAVAVIASLWSAWDAATGNATNDLADTRMVPSASLQDSGCRQSIRARLLALYQQDDFLGRLYLERVPPVTLRVRNGTLTGARVQSRARVQLHPPQDNVTAPAWSTATAALLRELLATVETGGGCHDTAGLHLDCALQQHLGDALVDTRVDASALAALVLRMEQRLPEDPPATAAQERATLSWLQRQVEAAKAVPVRGLEPGWAGCRPDPRSHLGTNLALARRVLRLLSEHPLLIARCAALQADPARLTFPLTGSLRAMARTPGEEVDLFDVDAPPPGLAAVTGMLRGLTAMLRAPVRASGWLQVPEMLAYYGIPWQGTARDDAAFDRCLAAIAQRKAALPEPVPPATRPPSPSPRDVQQAVIDQLWHLFESLPANASISLADAKFTAVPGAPVHAAWRAAQQQLLDLFEAEPLWRIMRGANVSFQSVRIAADQVTAGERGNGRVVHLNTTRMGADAAALVRLQGGVARLGCLQPGQHIPLSGVLTWHGVNPPAVRGACQVACLSLPAQQLQVLHQVYVRWSPTAADTSAHLRDMEDLRDLERTFERLQLDAQGHYRPALGTAAAAASHGALGPFALLLEHADVQAALDAMGFTPRLLSVDAGGQLVAHLRNGETHALPLPDNGTTAGALAPVLALLSSLATHLGGRVRSDGRVSLAELLSAHGGCGLRDGIGTDALRPCAERIRSELALGMRPHLVHARDLLDDADMHTLRTSTAAFLTRHAPADATLLQFLGTPLVESGRFQWNQTHRSRAFVAAMAQSPRALPLQEALLKALGWHGGRNATATSSTLRASLTACALVADLGPPSRPEARIVLGYRLHRQANMGRSFAAVRTDVETYLCSLGRLTATLCPMAATIALQDEAPELLSADIPSTLVFGSAITAVNYVSGVHLAERLRRGLSQQMTFNELVSLSAELSGHADVPAGIRQMAVDARGYSMLDWLYFRSRDDGVPRNATQAQRIRAALEDFDARVARIETAISDLLAPLPYRMPMVETDLRRVFPAFPGVFAGLAWNDTQLRLCNDRDWLRDSFPLHELVAAGELQRAPGDWYLCPVPDLQVGRGQDPQQTEALRQADFAMMQAAFPNLTDINARFQSAFDTYFANARDGYGVLIEEALYLRGPEERAAIARGEVELFTVRTFEPDLEAGQETATDTGPYRGRFGVLYCAGRNRSGGCHQLFPLLGRIDALERNVTLRLGGVLESRKVRLRHGHYATIQVRRGTPEPLDWDAFAHYRAPVAGVRSRVIIERLASHASAVSGHADELRSPFHALVAPIQQDFFWLDPVAFLHEARGISSFDAHLKAPPLWLKTVDFIFPFVENLRRLGTTDRNELAMAIFGLYLEGVLTIGPVVGGVAKVVMRPGLKVLPRFAEISRVLGRNALDALNPLAGSVAMARLGAGMAQRGFQGGLRFAWGRARHASLHGAEWEWVMREGMAVLRDGTLPAGASMQVGARTVQGVREVLVASHTSADGIGATHLFDPATLTPYGPLLQERLESSAAAGVLFKVGEGLRPPKPSPGKVLKPIKQGTKASQEDSGERGGTAPLAGIGRAGQRSALP